MLVDFEREHTKLQKCNADLEANIKQIIHYFLAAQFRSMLVGFEREHAKLQERNTDLEANIKQIIYYFLAAQFRSMLVDFEREQAKLQERNTDLEANIKQLKQLEGRQRSNELKVHDLQRRLGDTEKLRRDLEGKVCICCNTQPKQIWTHRVW